MRTRTGEDLTIGEVREREEAFERIARLAEDCPLPVAVAINELAALLKPLVLPIEAPR